MIIRENKKRSEGPDFKEREMVYLRRKNIKTKRPSLKLDQTKFGPYRITKRVHDTVYELQLPNNMRIHNRFHKSLLEKAPQNAKPGPVELDEETQEPKYEIEAILDCKHISKKKHFLIKWKGYDHTENTWEPEEHLT